MRHDLIVSQSVDINADLARVWRVLTDPTIIKEYLYGTQTETDWKPGSPIVFKGEYEGQTYLDKGVVTEFIPNKRLQYTYWSSFNGLEDKPENYSTITYELNFLSDHLTIFTWIQSGYVNEEAYKKSLKSMPEFMEQIRGIAEEVSA